MYNGWKSAYTVPLLIRPHAKTPSEPSTVSRLDLDYWITKPVDIVSRTWVRVFKEYETCAVLYYASIPASPEGVPSHVSVGETRVEDVGGILYMKLVDCEVVDVEEEEINDVLHHIGRYL